MDKLTTEQLLSKDGFTINDKRWKYNGNVPVVLKFSANWCSPCRTLSTTLNELSKEYKEIEFYEIDVEEEYELAEIFSIRSLPTVIFCNKENHETITGTVPKQRIEQILKAITVLV